MFNLKQVKDNLLFSHNLAAFQRKNIKLNSNHPLILIWEFGGFPAILRKNAIHSLALNLRGYRTKIIICDGQGKACIQRSIENKSNWSDACSNCSLLMIKEANRYGLEHELASKYISPQQVSNYERFANAIDINRIIRFRKDSVPYGSIAWNSFNRYMKGRLINLKQLDSEEKMILRSYLSSTLINFHIARAAIKREKAVAMLTSHGVYSDYAPAMYASNVARIPGTSWISGFTPQHFYFSSSNKLSHGDIRSPSKIEWLRLVKQPLTTTQLSELNQFISSRYLGQKSLDVTFKNDASSLEIYQPLKQRKAYSKVVCIFAHINWDVAQDNNPMLFTTSNQWIIETLKIAIKMSDILWIVKLHPSEQSEGHEYSTEQLILDYFPQLPKHIQLIRDSDHINPLYLYKQIDIGITLYGTVGVELAIFGKPSINVSSVHYAGKGFTHDAHNKKDYYSLLQNIANLPPLSQPQITLAKQYAYYYFITRQMTINVLENNTHHWGNLNIKKLDNLLPGTNKEIDQIYESIIRGS
ncbi:MAG: hypothetical protein ACD_40C00213G0028 [uncultured bacterium]|nr:MAG: hypothetical protein ACD_40C00213G0028 [uncultured bacterium]KKU26435.1 MAG: Capsule polysaccharide biosynthesis protein [Microgenomates group bacterium GW2011_GWA2_46_16]